MTIGLKLNKGKSYFLTPMLKSLTHLSKETYIFINSLSIDAHIKGFQNYPPDCMDALEPHVTDWNELKDRFKFKSQYTPAIKSINFDQERFEYIKHDPDKIFFFEIEDIYNNTCIKISADRIHFVNGKNGKCNENVLGKFLVNYYVRN